MIEFRDLVNQYKHVVAFGSPHADVDNIQIQEAQESLGDIFTSEIWQEFKLKMRNPNPEWKTTLDNRCQARMEELSNMAIISNPVKTVPGYAI